MANNTISSNNVSFSCWSNSDSYLQLIKTVGYHIIYKFINNCKKYLPFLEEAKYIGSFYVVRTIEINKEKTDERLNQILKINNKIFTILSGKWNTSVGLAKRLKKII